MIIVIVYLYHVRDNVYHFRDMCFLALRYNVYHFRDEASNDSVYDFRV